MNILSGALLLAAIAAWTWFIFKLTMYWTESDGIARRQRDHLCNVTEHNAAVHVIEQAAAASALARYHAGQPNDENDREYAREVRGARLWKSDQAEDAYNKASAAGGCGRIAIGFVVMMAGIFAIIAVWPG